MVVFVTLGILALLLWMTQTLSPPNRPAIRAMRDHPSPRGPWAYDVPATLLLTFGWGAAYAGVAGASPLLLDFIAPESSPTASILFLWHSVGG